MDKEIFDSIIENQKILKDLPNVQLVEQMDLLSKEHEEIKQIIINNTIYLDKIEELYNNILKVYQQRNGNK